MIGHLVELSAVGRKLKCCQHLKGYVGLVVDTCKEYDDGYRQKYWIDWVGITPEEAYGYVQGNRTRVHNGTWNRRDFKKIKNGQKMSSTK